MNTLQERARALAKFLRKDGSDVLSQKDWNDAADLEIHLATATATETYVDWLLKPKRSSSDGGAS
jgi:hypothetical protein